MHEHILLYVQRIVARNYCYILFHGTGHSTLITVFKDDFYMPNTSVVITQTEVSIGLHCIYHIRLTYSLVLLLGKLHNIVVIT